MNVSIGEIQAQCDSCGGVEFAPVPRSELRLKSELLCTRCGRKTLYGDLLEQIGERAMKQATDAFAKLRGKKDA